MNMEIKYINERNKKRNEKVNIPKADNDTETKVDPRIVLKSTEDSSRECFICAA